MKRVSPGTTEKFIQSLPLNFEGCIEWPFAKNSAGYGVSKRQYAHRVAYSLHKGEIPNGMVVMHFCDNPSCVNPEHLRVGTQKQNLQDRKQKGRHPKGKLSGTAKLSDKAVAEARRLHKAGATTVDLAKRFGVSQSAMWYAVSGTTWGHVDA